MNDEVVTHASTRMSMSLGDAAPWMYLVSNNRHAHEGRGHWVHEETSSIQKGFIITLETFFFKPISKESTSTHTPAHDTLHFAVASLSSFLIN